MKPTILAAAGIALVLIAAPARAHLIGEGAHDHDTPRYDFSVKPPGADGAPVWFLAQADSGPRRNEAGAATTPMRSNRPAQAAPFVAFAPKVKTRWDDHFVYVESDSMPDHVMMVGITAWQQQVPLPQPYFGENAWRIPLHPVVAKNPLSAKTNFFRGAIALAANGVPIFNPIKNDGRTDTLLAGELDEFGGHCGRGDDYHYHIAPTHLQKVVGADKPVAYALDGYAIYGYGEPDGAPAGKLDEFNGHETAALGYHYHATKTYPYLNGGFHGEVVERDGQVDPQPRAGGVREALPPWRGAKITGFTSRENKSFSVKVQVGSETHYVNYTLTPDGGAKFDFVDAKGQVETETYSPRQRGGGRGGKGGQGESRPDAGRGGGASAPAVAPMIITPKKSGAFKLTSPAVAEGAALPKEFNGDGEGATLPLEWKGAPAGTKSYALVMDHLAKGPEMKCYWTMWDIPPTVTSLPKNVQGVGKLGGTWKRGETYITPHSQGGGAKTYTLHIYALSKVPQFSQPQGEVTREVLLTAIKDSILDSADLNVTYTPVGGGERPPPRAPRPE